MSDGSVQQRPSAADQAGAAADQIEALGEQITQAADALYRAFKVFEEDSSRSGDSDYRVHFFDTFRLVTTAVASADGALSPERSTAIDQIFWLIGQTLLLKYRGTAPPRIRSRRPSSGSAPWPRTRAGSPRSTASLPTRPPIRS